MRNGGVLEAAGLTLARVRGLGASPAGRATGVKLPNPTRRTSSPRLRLAVTDSTKASIATLACAGESSVRLAISAISPALVMVASPPGAARRAPLHLA